MSTVRIDREMNLTLVFIHLGRKELMRYQTPNAHGPGSMPKQVVHPQNRRVKNYEVIYSRDYAWSIS
jgi:hypothetical protein